MMNAKDKIYLLYFETITGSISPEDQEFVRQELMANEQFRKVWLSLEREGEKLNIGAFTHRIDEDEALLDLKREMGTARTEIADGYPESMHLPADGRAEADGRLQVASKAGPELENLPGREGGYKSGPRPGRLVWRWAAAVCLLVSLAGIGYWLTGGAKITNIEKIASIVKQDKEAVELQLASGKKVTIPSHQLSQTINVSGGAIALNTDSLSFTAADTAQNVLIVPDGRFYHITLGDGTKVTLNSSSRLRFPFHFTGATREVFVEGEAYFSVTKDPSHPFIVHTPLTSIKVLGTKFNVNTYQEGAVKTALVEGSISTRANSSVADAIVLQPGNEASFEAQKGFVTSPFDRDNVLSWLEGLYYFHNMSIGQLSKAISRNFGVPVIVDNDRIKGRTVTGVMDRNNLQELLSDLSVTAGVKYFYQNNQLYLQ